MKTEAETRQTRIFQDWDKELTDTQQQLIWHQQPRRQVCKQTDPYNNTFLGID